MSKTFTCRACGTNTEQRTGRGRPWVVCRECKAQNQHRTYIKKRPSMTAGYRKTLNQAITASKRRQRAVAKNIYLEGVCVVCKRTHWMDAQAVAIGQQTCGNTTCSQRRRYRTTTYQDGIAHKNHTRRAAQRTGERINRSHIWERNHGLCHICNQAAGRDDWHLDHITPLSRGGTHTHDNVAVSHPALAFLKSFLVSVRVFMLCDSVL